MTCLMKKTAFEGLMTSKLNNLAPEGRLDESIVDRVFVETVGNDGHGRVHYMGIGASLPSVIKAKQCKESILEEKVKNLQDNLEAQKRESSQMKNEFDQMKNESNQMKKQVDEVMKMLQDQGFSVPISDNQNF